MWLPSLVEPGADLAADVGSELEHLDVVAGIGQIHGGDHTGEAGANDADLELLLFFLPGPDMRPLHQVGVEEGVVADLLAWQPSEANVSSTLAVDMRREEEVLGAKATLAEGAKAAQPSAEARIAEAASMRRTILGVYYGYSRVLVGSVRIQSSKPRKGRSSFLLYVGRGRRSCTSYYAYLVLIHKSSYFTAASAKRVSNLNTNTRTTSPKRHKSQCDHAYASHARNAQRCEEDGLSRKYFALYICVYIYMCV